MEIANRRARKSERLGCSNAAFIRRAVIRHAILRTDIFQSGVDLKLIVQVVDDLAVDAGAAFKPGRRNQPLIKFRTIDAVKLCRFVKEIDEAERDDVNTGCPPVKVIVEFEIDVRLLDFDRAGKFVVVVFGDAAVLEFEFGVEDDGVGDLQSREEDDALGVEAVLPIAGFFLPAELQLAVCANAQNCLAAIAEAKKCVVLWRFRRVARGDNTTFPCGRCFVVVWIRVYFCTGVLISLRFVFGEAFFERSDFGFERLHFL